MKNQRDSGFERSWRGAKGLAAATATATRPSFRQQTSPMGRPRIQFDTIGEALEILEGDWHR